MIKVVKFGGSSLADAHHFKKVYDIVSDDSDRRYIINSAPGKRFKDDTKITDLLILAYSNRKSDHFNHIFTQITDRFNEIINELSLDFSLDDEFDQMMPADFFDLWKNERLVGVPVSSADIANGLLKDKKYK